ncbi:hypothetical protein A0J61_04987 [Choanephora cucurbitarum]|uniref:Uncharacterized protein n=1 Tax=Choanephora cucurbitarum TaxID=101091 RepID=A0A1C7NDB5_9FUNG|nr:hypothetical protein A0J61_04987 [Choanephora cucurbitarum]
MNTIRNIFSLKKKSKKSSNHYSINQNNLPSSSVSSFTSNSSSSDSAPQTPTGMPAQETRGIFRTLEPVWYFHASLLADSSLRTSEWIPFDENSQYALEASAGSKDDCVLYQSALGPCTVMLTTSNPNKKKSRQTMFGAPTAQYSSMPSLRANGHIGRTLELDKHVRRSISPVWWFEQDSPDGSKGMCRFDYRNQVRFEALSEDRTRLALTDDAFNVPFTAVLEAPKEHELREEVRGFLFLEPVSTAFQRAFDASHPEKFPVENLSYDDEPWGVTLVRRSSI